MPSSPFSTSLQSAFRRRRIRRSAVAARRRAATSAALRPKRPVRAAVEATPAAAPWHRSGPSGARPRRSETSLAASRAPRDARLAPQTRRVVAAFLRRASVRRILAARSAGAVPRSRRVHRSSYTSSTVPASRRDRPCDLASDSAAPALRGRSRPLSLLLHGLEIPALSRTRRPPVSTAVWTSRAAWRSSRASMTPARSGRARSKASAGAKAAPRLGRSSLGASAAVERVERWTARGAWGASAASFSAPLVTRDDTSGDSSRASAPVASWPVVEVPAEGRPSRAEDDPSATFDPSEDAEGAACPSDASSPRRVSAAPSGRSGRDAGEDISAVRRACGGSASARTVWRASAPPRGDRTHAFLKKSAQLCPFLRPSQSARVPQSQEKNRP